MVERPVSEEELKKAKDSLSNSLPGAFESSANAVSNFSNVFIYDLGLDYYTRYAEQVNAVTAEQTLAAARKYLVPGSMIIVAVGDKAKIEPQLKKLNLGANRDSGYRRHAREIDRSTVSSPGSPAPESLKATGDWGPRTED